MGKVFSCSRLAGVGNMELVLAMRQNTVNTTPASVRMPRNVLPIVQITVAPVYAQLLPVVSGWIGEVPQQVENPRAQR